MEAIGLLFALVTGLGWMRNFRDALSVQWGHARHPPTSYLRRLGSDLASLIGLGLAIVLSFGLTAVASGGFAGQILGYLGLAARPVAYRGAVAGPGVQPVHARSLDSRTARRRRCLIPRTELRHVGYGIICP